MKKLESYWCPYLGREVNIDQTNVEHVIPLALGGSDEFVVRAETEMNSKLGSTIDGVLANEFLVAVRRVHFNARGHTRTPPVARLKKSTLQSTGDPVQIIFGQDKVKIWDAKKRREIDNSESGDATFSSTFRVDMFSRLRFMSKVALAGGYYIYGDAFRESFRHEELRASMLLESADRDAFSSFGLRLYDEFSDVAPSDRKQVMLDKSFCGLIGGSCLMTIPGPSSVGFVIGILGQWMGTLNVPADTSDLPLEGNYDLGHVVRIDAGVMRRLSYRQLATEALQSLQSSQSPKQQ